MAKDFDFTATLKGLVELVEMNCKKNEEYMEVSTHNELLIVEGS